MKKSFISFVISPMLLIGSLYFSVPAHGSLLEDVAEKLWNRGLKQDFISSGAVEESACNCIDARIVRTVPSCVNQAVGVPIHGALLEGMAEEFWNRELKQNLIPSVAIEESPCDCINARILRTVPSCVNQAVSSPDGTKMLIATDLVAQLCDVVTGTIYYELQRPGFSIFSTAYSANGTMILIGSGDGVACLCDAQTGNLIREFYGHKAAVITVLFSPDDAMVFTGSCDNTACLWDVATGRILWKFTDYMYMPLIATAVYSPSKMVIAGSNSSITRLLANHLGNLCTELKDQRGSFLYSACSHDGKRVLAGLSTMIAYIWDVATGIVVQEFKGNGSAITAVAYSQNGKTVLIAAGQIVYLWDVATGTLLAKLKGHTGRVTSVAYNSDTTAIVTGSEDKTVRMWDVSSIMTSLSDTVTEIRPWNRKALL